MSSERKDRLDATALLVVLACCTAWGLSQVAAKITLSEVPPLLQAGVRSVGAAALLLLWSRWRRLALFGADGTGVSGVLAGLLFAVEFACVFIGLQYTTASRMVVFLYLAPFVVALGMPLITRSERLSLVQGAGLVLAFGGVVWAFAEGFAGDFAKPVAAPLQWLGDALGIAAAVLWGLTTLLLRATRLASALPEKTLLYQLVISGVALLLASALSPEHWPRALSAAVAGSLLFQTAVVTFASYLAWFWLVRHYAATRVAAFTLLTPVFGLLAGVLLLNEPLTLQLLVALAAVCAGIALVNRPPRRP